MSLFGGDRSGWHDGEEALFDEPGGISVANGALYVADANNHVIRVADLGSKEVRTLVLVGGAGQLSRYAEVQNEALRIVTLEPQTVGMGEDKVSLELGLPEGVKLNDLAPFSFDWRSDSQAFAWVIGLRSAL